MFNDHCVGRYLMLSILLAQGTVIAPSPSFPRSWCPAPFLLLYRRSVVRAFLISFSTSSSRSYSNLRYPCFAIELYIGNLRNQFSIPGHRKMTASSPRTFSIPRHDNSTNAENRTSSNAFSTWMKWSLDCANTSSDWILISCITGQHPR